MSETKPLKRHPALVELSKDHHFGLLLTWKIRQGEDLGVDTDRIGKYILHFFDSELEYHFREEEELLFNQMPVGDAMRVQAEKEHEQMRLLIARIRDKISLEDIHDFSRSLEQHIRFEERSLFNHIQQIFAEELLGKIELELRERKHPEGKPWLDNFWIKKK